MDIQHINDVTRSSLNTKHQSSTYRTPQYIRAARDLEKISSERDYHLYLLEKLREEGWTAHRHVTPDNSQYEVDLLIRHPDYGDEWIGIEAKYVKPGELGTKIGNAHIQITEKYWNQTYNGERVDLWAVAPFHVIDAESPKEYLTHALETNRTLQQMTSRYGIGYLWGRYGIAKLDFHYSDGSQKIPAFGIASDIMDYQRDNVDIGEIKRVVTKKRSAIESY